jgi:acetoin utilization deacetylase AcuC-like enzyme
MEDVDLLTRDILSRAKACCEGRVISSLEGGYAPERLGAGVVAHVRAML